MGKQIHIHLHRTADAGSFNESDHKRDAAGRFSTTGGSGGSAEHHAARRDFHNSEMRKKGSQHPDYASHKTARYGHHEASEFLGRANAAGSAGTPIGNESAKQHVRSAQLAANEAAAAEERLGAAKKPTGAQSHVSLGAMQHVVQRPNQVVIGGSKPGNSVTIGKTDKPAAQTMKRLAGTKPSREEIKQINVKFNTEHMAPLISEYQRKIAAITGESPSSVELNPSAKMGEGYDDPKAMALVKEFQEKRRKVHADWAVATGGKPTAAGSPPGRPDWPAGHQVENRTPSGPAMPTSRPIGKPMSTTAPWAGQGHPLNLNHGGVKHIQTGKTDTEGGAEYEAVNASGERTGARVWRSKTGAVRPD